MLFLLFALLADAPTPFEVVRVYDKLLEVSEEYLSNPYTADFAANGDLYVGDSKNCRIHVWGPDGVYKFSFGTQGHGPGEIFIPSNIDVTEKHVWVWDWRNRLTRFDLKGNFEESFDMQVGPRDFAIVNEDAWFVAFKQIRGPRDIRAVFAMINKAGDIKIVKDFKMENYLTQREGENATTVKAFSPEMDIQQGPGQTWYFGYSQNNKIYQVNAAGEIISEKAYDIPTQKPSENERDFIQNMSGPIITGDVFSIKDAPNLRINYDYDKAYYIHFLVQDNRIAFILTPIGGMHGCGLGFWKGTYYVNDFKSGKVAKRGQYDFRTNSQVLFIDGRILGVILTDEDEFVVQELKLKDFAQ